MSSPNASRRLFLRGKVDTRRHLFAIRPPYSLEESLFIEACSRCGACISACPENIIVKGDGGYPEVDFKEGECTFCNQCAEVCQSNAIQAQNGARWNLDVSVTSKCLSMNAVVCRACSDNCECQAIDFQLKVGGISEPQLSMNKCTGCGACVAVCPVNAVQIKPKVNEQKVML